MVCRSVWLAETTCWSAGRVPVSRLGPGQPMMTAEQRLDLTLHPNLGVDQDDEVVADPFQVGDDMGGEQDAELVLGDGLHQDLQELPAGQRVEAGDRLVEDQQLGSLGQAQGEGELSALPAGQLPGPLGGVEAEPLDPGPSHGVVPARVEPGTEPQVVARCSARRRWGCPGRRSRPWPVAPHCPRDGHRTPRSCPSSASAGQRPGSAGWSCRRRWGRPARSRARPGCPACSPTAPTGAGNAYPVPGRAGRRSRYLLIGGPKGAGEQRLDALIVEAGQPGLGQPAPQVPAQRLVRRERGVGQ